VELTCGHPGVRLVRRGGHPGVQLLRRGAAPTAPRRTCLVLQDCTIRPLPPLLLTAATARSPDRSGVCSVPSPPALLLHMRATAEPRLVALVRVVMSSCMLLCSARSYVPWSWSYANRCGLWLVACSMPDITSKPPCMLLCSARSYVPWSRSYASRRGLWPVACSMADITSKHVHVVVARSS
jgi:hypothetical protein